MNLRSSALIFTFLLLGNVVLWSHKDLDSLRAVAYTISINEKPIVQLQIAKLFEDINLDSSESYYQSSIKGALEIKNDSILANGLQGLGIMWCNSGKLNEALTYLFQALKVFDQKGLKAQSIKTMQHISIVYNQQNINDKAMEFAEKALLLARQENIKYSVSTSLTIIGSIHYSEDDLDKAIKYFEDALKIMEELDDKQGISDAINNVALIYSEQGKYNQALDYHKRSLKMAKELNDKRGVAASYHNIGVAYKSMQDYEATFRYCDSCIAIANEVEDKYYLLETYSLLADVYALQGKYDLAYNIHIKYAALKDSLINVETNKQIVEMGAKYESDNKDNLISLLNKDNALSQEKVQRQKLVRNVFIGGFIVVLMFATILLMQRNRISKAKKRSDELLNNILPKEVAEELKQNGSARARQFNEVTVMFTDFKNFTQISEKLTPTELVDDIHRYFIEFDRIIEKYNIEKIKTIGDAYMCASGMPLQSKTHAYDMVCAAIEIQQFMKDQVPYRLKEGKEPFEIRIGMSSGTVVAGIVGAKKFAYDIWGDTVNIANRMEAAGEAGKVNISGSTYELVKDLFTCNYRGKVFAKNKGEIDMYYVESIL